jgi:hypothetical protein
MIVSLGLRLSLVGLLGFAAVVPACGQDAAGDAAKAQQTVAEIARLIDEIHARAATPAAAASTAAAPETALFDGKSLAGWKRTDFHGGGKVRVERSFRGGPGAIVVDAGSALSGLTWTGARLPRTNYEIDLEMMKIEGMDFPCGLTFPVAASHASLILGGWGGLVTGISSIEGHDASENETTRSQEFPKDRWYTVRMRVTPAKLETWLDGKKIVDANIEGKTIGLRFGEISKSAPLGLATYQTSAAFRNIRLLRLPDAK